MKTRDIRRHYYNNYLKKAEECYRAAIRSIENREWNAAAITAIHACISGCDALCVYYLGKRSADENHNQSVKLLKQIKNIDTVNINANRLSRILSLKNVAEYEEGLITQKNAEIILKDCERFISFVKKALKSTFL